MVTKIIDLNLKDPTIVPAIHVSKLDSGLRAFEFRLYNGDELYNIPSNVSITLQGIKPDKNGFVNGCTYNGNVVNVDCTEQMTAVEGSVRCNLVLVDTNRNRIASFLFYILVLPIGVDDKTVISDSEIAYANEVINELQSVGAYDNRLKVIENKNLMTVQYISSSETASFYRA